MVGILISKPPFRHLTLTSITSTTASRRGDLPPPARHLPTTLNNSITAGRPPTSRPPPPYAPVSREGGREWRVQLGSSSECSCQQLTHNTSRDSE
ncbi:hypothetical protein E2C01_002275 [Portunus trituberculatus]|uniref:Uncharacterized protein n=1 Tax=Portunus trituberculatus TaxID=210409 RepID=A0A5B7CJI1_PORTR|nr:hypothetical protein [Portunus trituberculatus]